MKIIRSDIKILEEKGKNEDIRMFQDDVVFVSKILQTVNILRFNQGNVGNNLLRYTVSRKVLTNFKFEFFKALP